MKHVAIITREETDRDERTRKWYWWW